MTDLEIFWHQIDIARQNDDETGSILRRFTRARAKQVKPRPVMETFNWPRQHFMQLRNRHLHMVEEYGIAATYNRHELGKHFLTNWNRLFGTLRRSKALEVPSDRLRKEIMICRLLDLIEMRRSEYADERAKYFNLG
jgi:hypothetical protein